MLIVVMQACKAADSGESMTCSSPAVLNVTSQHDVIVDVSFTLDAVAVDQSSFQLHYVQDPATDATNTSCTAVTLPDNSRIFVLTIHVCTSTGFLC